MDEKETKDEVEVKTPILPLQRLLVTLDRTTQETIAKKLGSLIHQQVKESNIELLHTDGRIFKSVIAAIDKVLDELTIRVYIKNSIQEILQTSITVMINEKFKQLNFEAHVWGIIDDIIEEKMNKIRITIGEK